MRTSRVPVGDRITSEFQKAVWMIVRHEIVRSFCLHFAAKPLFFFQQAQAERRARLSLEPDDARPLRRKRPESL